MKLSESSPKEEVWMTPWCSLVFLEWDLRGNLIMTWGTKFSETGTFLDQNKEAFTRALIECGWVRL